MLPLRVRRFAPDDSEESVPSESPAAGFWKRMFDSVWLYGFAAAALIIGFLATQVEIAGDPRPLGDHTDIAKLHERDDVNLLFILIDTLRADRLGAYGYERDTSPVIDGLAATGVRFAEQLAQSSWTKCSMASLWTGLYPVRTGVTRSPRESRRTP